MHTGSTARCTWGIALLGVLASSMAGAAEEAAPPGGPPWKARSMDRPRPPVVEPGVTGTPDAPGRAPSDAIVLFDGKDLSKWRRQPPRNDPNPADDTPKWKVENGTMEIVPKSGTIFTRDAFGDCQLHIEWATPAEVKGNSQGRGNSGVFIVGHPEIQVLDSYGNDTYPDGQAAALYGRWPPLVNASRPPGAWQTYDIIYLAPRYDDQRKLVAPARYTVFHNGLLVHHNVEVGGGAVECPISLQDHSNPVRYRNIWVRPLKGYDGEEVLKP